MTGAPSTFRRVLALIILVAVVGALWSAIIDPLVSAWDGQRQDIAQMDRLIAGFRRAAAAEPLLRRQLAEIQKWDTSQPGFLEGPAPAVVAAKLQSDLKQIIEAQHGRIVSTQPVAPVGEGGFQRIGMRIDFRTDPESMLKISHAIEAASPVLFIDNVGVHATETPLTVTPGSAEDLNIQWEIHGYMREPPR